MVKLVSTRLFWGIILVLGGALLLLDTFGIFKGNALFWTIISAIAGILFLSIYFTNHDNWWSIIPGVIFLFIAIAIGLDSFLPQFSKANLTGPVILAGIAISFLFVYIAERANWWALIPAGVMATIVIVAILDINASGLSTGIFFIGLGITFALVAILPNTIGQMRWAWIPAGILSLIGLLILIAAEDLINYIWPSVLIVAGIYMVWRSLRVRR